MNREATSVRQAAEWGNGALLSSFPRLKERFPYEERGERKIMLSVIILLYNFRSRHVGINQILHVYMPHLSAEANYILHSIN